MIDEIKNNDEIKKDEIKTTNELNTEIIEQFLNQLNLFYTNSENLLNFIKEFYESVYKFNIELQQFYEYQNNNFNELIKIRDNLKNEIQQLKDEKMKLLEKEITTSDNAEMWKGKKEVTHQEINEDLSKLSIIERARRILLQKKREAQDNKK